MSSECNRYQMALSAWMDEELDSDSTRALFLHLAECENCRSFWRTSSGVEKQLLKEGRVRGSAIIDARIASIGRQDRLGGNRRGLEGRSNASFQDRSSIGGAVVGPKDLSERRSFPYSIAAIVSVLAVTVGFILGSARPSSGNGTDGREPQVIYVSVLPNITVVGHIAEQVPKVH
ncbi:MAG: zf-HC2 domain-containing protein [Ignavibacteria bacterium]|nr:zf-HC2 domain-containing protein [Ignavibacteria bacterium]